MKIVYNESEVSVHLILNERLYINKLNAISKAKTSKGAIISTRINSGTKGERLVRGILEKYDNRKKHVKDILIIYKWGKSKQQLYEIEDPDTGETIEKSIPKYYYTSELFSSINFENKKITRNNLINKMQENLELNYDAFQRQIADTSNIHPLREIIFKFLY